MLNRIFFVTTLIISVTLIVLVLLLPLLGEVTLAQQPRVVRLIAHDLAVRRACLACGLGLIATAVVFFRGENTSVKEPKRPAKDTKKAKRARSTRTVGA
ncbi:MAG: hypothetical protein ACFCD0_17455 [Gemmataceae bacterium]